MQIFYIENYYLSENNLLLTYIFRQKSNIFVEIYKIG